MPGRKRTDETIPRPDLRGAPAGEFNEVISTGPAAAQLAPDRERAAHRFIDDVRKRRMTEAVARFWPLHTEFSKWPLQGRPLILDHCARTLDRDKSHIEMIDTWIRDYRRQVTIAHISASDTTRLRLAEAIVLFHREKFREVIQPLELVRSLADDCGYDDLQAMARYYLARALYRVGENSEAMKVISEAESLIPHNEAIPVIRMVKIWILFNEESVEEAEGLLDQVEKAFTGRDYIEDANILSLRGRFARQKGQYKSAAEMARQAIKMFVDHKDHTHQNLARCYVHWSFALLLQAQDSSPDPKLLWRQAIEALDAAEVICNKGSHGRVLDRVHYFRACWYEHLGKLTEAKREAEKAFGFAQVVDYHVNKAHARNLQSKCARKENDHINARRWAIEAFNEANNTDNRRVRARTFIWKGLTEADHTRRNLTAATGQLEQAKGWMRNSDQDYLRREFNELDAYVTNPVRVENKIDLSWATVDYVQSKGLAEVLRQIKKKICEAVHERVGTVSGAANDLVIQRNTLKRILKLTK